MTQNLDTYWDIGGWFLGKTTMRMGLFRDLIYLLSREQFFCLRKELGKSIWGLHLDSFFRENPMRRGGLAVSAFRRADRCPKRVTCRVKAWQFLVWILTLAAMNLTEKRYCFCAQQPFWWDCLWWKMSQLCIKKVKGNCIIRRQKIVYDNSSHPMIFFAYQRPAV